MDNNKQTYIGLSIQIYVCILYDAPKIFHPRHRKWQCSTIRVLRKLGVTPTIKYNVFITNITHSIISHTHENVSVVSVQI